MAESADKKTNQTDDSTNPEAALEHHVDELMDPSLPDPKGPAPDAAPAEAVAAAPEVAGPPAAPAEINIFENSEAAPAEAKTPPIDKVTDEKIPEDKSVDVDNPDADPLVDDIVSEEGDQLLAVQDNEIAQAFGAQTPTFRERVKDFFIVWWDNKLARYVSLVALLLLLTTAGVVPGSRYFVLNTAGVRAKASLTILDSTTDLPLRNVDVTLGGSNGRTNEDGVVRLSGLKLGTQSMTVEQLGFAVVNRTVTLGLGSNPLGEVELKAVGTQYTFKITDYLTGKPVQNVEASSGDANAQSDTKGEVVLTIGSIDGPKLDVDLKAGGYRSEKITIDTATKQPTNVVMVNKRKEVFVSKQSGKLSVYKVDIDGRNRQLLLAGSGLERDQISLVPHATDETVALVSSRENRRNQDGYLLDTLTLIDVNDGSTLTLENSERIQIVDWIGDRLIYIKIKAGTSAGNPERYQLISYDYNTTTRLQLATANNFTDIISAKGAIYYAASNTYQGGQSQFAKVNPDNTGKQTLLTAEVWNIIRTSYDDFYLAGSYTGNAQNWYSYHAGDTAAKKMSQAPANSSETRFYLDAADGKHALWTESRDGKGVLFTYDASANKDATLATQSGLSYPLRWLDSRTVIYRIAAPGETASYVVSLDGGSPKKVTDVTNVNGLGKWYYGYY